MSEPRDYSCYPILFWQCSPYLRDPVNCRECDSTPFSTTLDCFVSSLARTVLGECLGFYRHVLQQSSRSHDGTPLCAVLVSSLLNHLLIQEEPGRPRPAEVEMGKPFPPTENLQAILFDVDGTLTDSDPLHFQAFQEVFQQAGFNGGEPITKEYFLKNISGKLNTVIALEHFPTLSEAERQKVTDDKEARFRSLAKEQTEPIPGLMKLTEWIKARGLRRAAVSNSPRDNVEQVIDALGLTSFFELVVIGNECERPKPFPDPYLKALQHFHVASDNAIVFEDSPAGLRAGVAAQISVVGLTTGHPKADLLAGGASLIIEDYNDPSLWANLKLE